MRKDIEERVWQLAEPIAQAQGLLIYDIEFVKEGPDWYLRVYIDREEGTISIDDCEAVSRPLSDALDTADPIDEAYYLEVSSPGMERKLKRPRDFERFMGANVVVKLFRAIDGKKKLRGVLTSRTEQETAVTEEDGTVRTIPNQIIVSVRLEAEF